MIEPKQASDDQPDRGATVLPRVSSQALSRFATTLVASWWRLALAGTIALIVGAGTLGAIWFLARPLALLILGLTFAALLEPPVAWLERWLPRVAGVFLVYLVVLVVLAGIGWLTIPRLASQLRNASIQIPNLVNQAQPIIRNLDTLVGGNLASMLSSQLGSLPSALLSLPLTVFSSVLDIGLVLFVSIYALIEVPAMQRFVLSLFPEERQDDVNALLHHMGWEMGGYLRGAILDGLIIGVTIYVGLFLIGVDYPLVLGLLAGALELIPLLGAIIAAIPMLGIALLQSTTKALITLIFVLAVHQFEGNLVFPNVMRTQTEISPLLVLLAFSAGGLIGGLLGAITAIPLVAVLRVFFLQVVVPAVRRQTGAADPSQG